MHRAALEVTGWWARPVLVIPQGCTNSDIAWGMPKGKRSCIMLHPAPLQPGCHKPEQHCRVRNRERNRTFCNWFTYSYTNNMAFILFLTAKYDLKTVPSFDWFLGTLGLSCTSNTAITHMLGGACLIFFSAWTNIGQALCLQQAAGVFFFFLQRAFGRNGIIDGYWTHPVIKLCQKKCSFPSRTPQIVIFASFLTHKHTHTQNPVWATFSITFRKKNNPVNWSLKLFSL